MIKMTIVRVTIRSIKIMMMLINMTMVMVMIKIIIMTTVTQRTIAVLYIAPQLCA
jgi:hypothetical protein